MCVAMQFIYIILLGRMLQSLHHYYWSCTKIYLS